MSSNWQCIKYQLYELTVMMKSRDKRKKMKIIINCERHKMKWNSKNHQKNEKNKHEYCWSSRINNIQQNENVKIQNYTQNELIMTT